jgi:fused signal recognition particle receptor
VADSTVKLPEESPSKPDEETPIVTSTVEEPPVALTESQALDNEVATPGPVAQAENSEPKETIPETEEPVVVTQPEPEIVQPEPVIETVAEPVIEAVQQPVEEAPVDAQPEESHPAPQEEAPVETKEAEQVEVEEAKPSDAVTESMVTDAETAQETVAETKPEEGLNQSEEVLVMDDDEDDIDVNKLAAARRESQLQIPQP